MSRTHRVEPIPPAELVNLEPPVYDYGEPFPAAIPPPEPPPCDHYREHPAAARFVLDPSVDAPETWTAELLRAVRLWSAKGPWRSLGGIQDHGVVHGTIPGAHRYYFAFGRGRATLTGTVVANSARAVERWVRDELRGDEPIASRDRRTIRGCLPTG